MLAIPHLVRIHLAVEPVDRRKSYGLWGAVCERLQEDPKSGALFVFINKSRTRLKLLYWDGTGVWVLAKRLEEGRFSWPAPSQAGAKLTLTAESAAAVNRRRGAEVGVAQSVVRVLKGGMYRVIRYGVSAPAIASGEVTLLRQEIAALRAQVEWLKKRPFGTGKSETLEWAQLLLKLGELKKLAASAAPKTETITYERPSGKPATRTPPAEAFVHLPVKETVEIVPEEVKAEPDTSASAKSARSRSM